MTRNTSLAVVLVGFGLSVAYAQDPPSRVARLNFISGSASMQPAGADDWSPAVVNRPLTTGDYLWTDDRSRAELHLNNAVLRLGDRTSFGFLNLDDRIAQVKFSEGELNVQVRRLESGETFEIDTPNAAITILREGEYRFNVGADNRTSLVVVRQGEVEVTGGGQAFTLRSGDSARLSGIDALAYDLQGAPGLDSFDHWCQERENRESRAQSARYVSPDVIGYEDLDDHGVWRDSAEYGAVWYPTVAPGWAPYRTGHWAWIEPWGWTWVDDAPWGFAPFHYGRWIYVGGGWGWAPGPVAVVRPGRVMVRPVYSPALVAFIGGSNWGVSVVAGGGPAVGWVPLGYGEIYRPAYRVSPHYFNRVNVSNTTIHNTVNITNVYNTTYVENRVVNQNYMNTHAVTAMPQGDFANGRPVVQVGRPVRSEDFARLQGSNVTVAPAVVPTRQALAPMRGGLPAARPPAGAMNTQVVGRTAPPAPPARFETRQQVLQQNAGRPLDMQTVRQASQDRQPVAAPPVRVVPPVRQQQEVIPGGWRRTTDAPPRAIPGSQPQRGIRVPRDETMQDLPQQRQIGRPDRGIYRPPEQPVQQLPQQRQMDRPPERRQVQPQVPRQVERPQRREEAAPVVRPVEKRAEEQPKKAEPAQEKQVEKVRERREVRPRPQPQ